MFALLCSSDLLLSLRTSHADLCRAILAKEHSFPVTSMMLFSPRRFLATATFSITPLFLESSSTHTKNASWDSNIINIYIQLCIYIYINHKNHSCRQGGQQLIMYIVIPGSLSPVYKKCVLKRSEFSSSIQCVGSIHVAWILRSFEVQRILSSLFCPECQKSVYTSLP